VRHPHSEEKDAFFVGLCEIPAAKEAIHRHERVAPLGQHQLHMAQALHPSRKSHVGAHNKKVTDDHRNDLEGKGLVDPNG
jgi:hypothetical protein